MQDGTYQVTFTIELCTGQARHRRWLQHEASTSVARDALCVSVVECDQCAFGIWCSDSKATAVNVAKRSAGGARSGDCRTACIPDTATSWKRKASRAVLRRGTRPSLSWRSCVLSGVLLRICSFIRNCETRRSPTFGHTHPGWHYEVSDAEVGQCQQGPRRCIFSNAIGACDYCVMKHCNKATGKSPVPVTWLDIDRRRNVSQQCSGGSSS